MDLREVKTRANIKNAFLEIRSHKPLEKITVKELVQAALVSKGTFYLHYKDIYDLSEQMQKETIRNILNGVTDHKNYLDDPKQFIHELLHGFYAYQSLIDILFSGNQAPLLQMQIEKEMKQYLFAQIPELKDDLKTNVLLSYQIQGGFHAFTQNRKIFGNENVLKIIDEITDLSMMIHKNKA